MKYLIIIGVVILLLVDNDIAAQEDNYNSFIKETQNSKSESGKISIAWWIPIEFWELTFQRDKSMSEIQINEFVKLLKPYTIFAIVDGKIGLFGGIEYTPVDSILNTIELIDKDSIAHKPLKTEELNAGIENLLLVFKPILKNMMGQIGENMNFYVFKDENDKKLRIADPYIEGHVRLNYYTQKKQWRTPLGSLLPLKKCTIDNELMNGAWKYCPWHGIELIQK